MKRSRSVSLFAYFSKRSKGVETPCTIRSSLVPDPNVRKHYHMMYNTAYSTYASCDNAYVHLGLGTGLHKKYHADPVVC